MVTHKTIKAIVVVTLIFTNVILYIYCYNHMEVPFNVVFPTGFAILSTFAIGVCYGGEILPTYPL